MSIFLEPETTFAVTVNHAGGAEFTLADGGPIVLRTATGREFARLMESFRGNDGSKTYDVLRPFIKAGMAENDIERLHPNVVALLLYEVAKRSHVTETAAGN